MPDKICIIVLFFLIFSSCSRTKCAIEDVAIQKRQFKNNFSAWSKALDFMDEEVIRTAYANLDSSFHQLMECQLIPEDFMILADSVSSIFVADTIFQNQLDGANQILIKLQESLPD